MTCRPKRADMLAAETAALRLLGDGPVHPLDVWREFVERGLVDVREDGWVYVWVESRSGRVVLLERPREYAPVVKHRLSLSVDGQRHITYTHHLVWDEFCGPLPEGHVVCQRDPFAGWGADNLGTKPHARAAELRKTIQRQARQMEWT